MKMKILNATKISAYFNSNANANIPAQWDVEVQSDDGDVLSRRVEDYGQSENDAALEVVQSYHMNTCPLCKESGLSPDAFENLPFPSAFLHTRFKTPQTPANTLVCIGCHEGEFEKKNNEAEQRYLDDLVGE